MMEPTMILRRMEEQLRSDYQIDLCEANTIQLHKALADAVMYGMSDDWRRSRRAHEMVRRAYYFSAVWCSITYIVWACWMRCASSCEPGARICP